MPSSLNPDDLHLMDCPECSLPAVVLDRFTFESTSGLIAHVKLRCVQKHNYAGPVLWT